MSSDILKRSLKASIGDSTIAWPTVRWIKFSSAAGAIIQPPIAPMPPAMTTCITTRRSSSRCARKGISPVCRGSMPATLTPLLPARTLGGLPRTP